MAKKGNKAGKDRHQSPSAAGLRSSKGRSGSDSPASRGLQFYVLPVAVAIFLAYVFASSILPAGFGGFGGGNGGGAAESGAAEAASPAAAETAAAAPLQALRTAARVCRANVSHPVVFEQLHHIKIWTIESFLSEDQALALHALLAAEPPPSEGADGSSWVCVSFLFARSLGRSVSRSFMKITRSLNCSLIHESLARSRNHSLIRSLARSFTKSLTHALAVLLLLWLFLCANYFRYTSNRVTERGVGTNHKDRGNKNIADRRARAQWARDLGNFAYSKNELNATHPTFNLIREFLSGGSGSGRGGAVAGSSASFDASGAAAGGPTEAMRCVSNLTGLSLVEVTDMFVSM